MTAPSRPAVLAYHTGPKRAYAKISTRALKVVFLTRMVIFLPRITAVRKNVAERPSQLLHILTQLDVPVRQSRKCFQLSWATLLMVTSKRIRALVSGFLLGSRVQPLAE